MAVLLQQAQKYTSFQMEIIHSDKIDYTPSYVINVYEKALRLNDENALFCLSNKFYLEQLYLTGEVISSLEQAEIDSHFDDIFSMIKEVNPDTDKEAILQSWDNANKKHAHENVREYGGRYNNDCFIEENGIIYFLISKYLEKQPDGHIIKLLKATGNYTYAKKEK